MALTTNGRSASIFSSGLLEDIKRQNANTIYKDQHTYHNPSKYYINGYFHGNLTDSVFHIAGYVEKALQDTPVYIAFRILECPLGFSLSVQPRKCECHERLLKHNLTCNINDQTVHRDGTTWVNASFNGNTSNGVIVHHYCPFAYCKQEPVDIDLANPDAQCAFNRSGTLCGTCKVNFSLSLGDSQCLENCSSSHLLLLIPFALAGFTLVFFIKVFNLTVSQGTMNGLIFYANIVAANQSIFFPAQKDSLLSFLAVVISWLNLDLGIETCFVKGLDGYWKTWLQFVFPLYVWAIAGAIILVSHCSSRATKAFGENSVSVLATLFVFSYSKLLQSTITIFSFTTLVYADDSTLAVWAFDGNICYFGLKHIPLFLFALVVVLLLWLPYTAVLLSAQWLRTQTHRKCLRWLKPFLDAYYGPFKDNHHYWVGILLVVRGVLFIIFASFISVESNVNLLLVIATSLFLFAYVSITGSVYKKIHLTVLENSFFLNLGVLAAGTLYIRLVGGSQEALVKISVSIAFIQFTGIISFHMYKYIAVPLGNFCRSTVSSRVEHQHTVELEPILNLKSETDRPKNTVTHSEVSLAVLRKDASEQSNTSSYSRRKSTIQSQ